MENPLEGLFSGEEFDIQCEGIGEFRGVVRKIVGDSIYFSEVVFEGGREMADARLYFMSHNYGIYSIEVGGHMLYLNKAVKGAFKTGELSNERERNEIREQAESFEDHIAHS
jgi:hypothetical protein